MSIGEHLVIQLLKIKSLVCLDKYVLTVPLFAFVVLIMPDVGAARFALLPDVLFLWAGLGKLK